jgi:hypothetical protein
MSGPTGTPVREQVKAVAGGVLAGLGTLGGALADGAVTPLEWVAVAIAVVVTYGAVFGVGQPAPLPHLTAAEHRRLADQQEAAQR